MLSHPLQRLLWKDARVLAPVWLALLAAVVAIQGVFVALSWLEPGESWFDGQPLSWETLAMVTMPLAFCLAAAAAAILFAGESEERTDEWLRVLPVPARSLALAKLGAGLLSLLMFIAAGLATAGLLAWIGLSSLERPSYFATHVLLETVGINLLTGLAAFATGVFLSVRMRRVIAVVAATLIGCLPLFGVADWFLNDVVGIRNDLGAPLLFTAIGLLDLWLVVRWSRGESVSLPWSRVMPAVGDAYGRLLGRTTPMGERTGPTFGDRIWLRSLQSAARLGSPTARALAVQFWREVRRARLFVSMWVMAGAIMLLPTLWDKSRWLPIEVLWLLAGLYWCLTPGLCGALAAAGERPSDQHLFLGYRGVSATTTWLAKQATWLTLACLLTIGWTWGQHALAPDGKSLIAGLTNGIHLPALRSSTAVWIVTPQVLALRQEFCAVLLVSLYAIGQLCGFRFRNSIVAIAMTVFLSAPLAAWLFITTAADIPPWMSTGSLAALWLIATWRLMDDWQCGRSSRRLKWRQTGWTVLPCLVALLLCSYHRRTQIPWVEMPPGLVHSAAVLGSPARTQSPAPSWPRLRDEIVAFVAQQRQIEDRPATAPWSEEQIEQLDARFAAFASQARVEGYTASGTASPGGVEERDWVGAVWSYATNRGRLLQRAGERRRELQVYIDSLSVLRAVRRLPVVDDHSVLQVRVGLFALIADWAQHKETTPGELRDVLQSQTFQRETTIELWAEPVAYVDSMAALVQQLYDESPRELSPAWGLTSTLSPWLWRAMLLADTLLGERQRTERFLQVCRVNADAIATWDWRTGEEPAGVPAVSRAEIERWAATTGPLQWLQPSRFAFGERTLELMSSLAIQGQTELACERALRLLIALELYRREQGAYPEALVQLVPKYLPALPTDPFTGAEFEYLPHGLDAPWLLDSRTGYSEAAWRSEEADVARLRLLPSGLPLLYSRGPHSGGYLFEPFAESLPSSDQRTRRPGLYREVVNGFVDGGGPSGRLPRVQRSLGQILAQPGSPPGFVVLGVRFRPWTPDAGRNDQ